MDRPLSVGYLTDGLGTFVNDDSGEDHLIEELVAAPDTGGNDDRMLLHSLPEQGHSHCLRLTKHSVLLQAHVVSVSTQVFEEKKNNKETEPDRRTERKLHKQ